MATINEIAVDVTDILETIEQFGWASPEQIAWEFTVGLDAIEPAWRQAIREGLIRDRSTTGKLFSQLTSRGRRRLRASRGEV